MSTSQAMPATSVHRKIPGGIVAAIVILCLVIVGIVIASIFLTKRLKPPVSFANCLNQANHGVTAQSGKVYWLGAMSKGVSLFTSFDFPMDDDGAHAVGPYNLTSVGLINAVTHVTSPMMGNPYAKPSSSLRISQNVTPPPPPSVFEWNLVGITSIEDFQKAAVLGKNAVQLSTEGGDPLCRLVVLSIPNTNLNVRGDICFLCSAPSSSSGTDWQPLTVIGGLVWELDTTAVGTDPSVTYNVGCMPLFNLLTPTQTPPAPGIAWLNCYPQVPLIGSVTVQNTSSVLNMPNHAQTPDSKPTKLNCSFDTDYQVQSSVLDSPPEKFSKDHNLIPQAVPEDGYLNTVLGCQSLTIPAFDIVAPPVASVENARNYLDAITPIEKAKDPAQAPIEAIARVGTTSAIGVIRVRRWVEATATEKIAGIIRASNPDITTSKKNPYAGPVHPVPKQYTQKLGGSTNAATLMFPAPHAMWALDPANVGLLCTAASAEHVSDLAVAQQAPAVPFDIDEPILSFFHRPTLYEHGGVHYSSVPQFVAGWGMTTGIMYMTCGQPNTNVYSGTKLLNNQQPTCGLCKLPQLISRTFCWPNVGTIDPTAPPFIDAADTQLLPDARNGGPDTAANPTPLRAPATSDLDHPYIALGAAVGRSTIMVGGHAASVRPWVPIFTAPTGDEGSYGFGRYSGYGEAEPGNLPPAKVFPGVFGLCNTAWSP